MLSKQYGFTLILLFILIFIIGVSIAIAIPAYFDYLIRGQVTEGITIASKVKMAVNDYWAQHGILPANNTEVGIAPAENYYGNYTSSVTVAHGQILINYGNYANRSITDHVLTLTPVAMNQSTLSWVCGNKSMRYMDGVGTMQTDILANHLPAHCQ